MNYKTKIYQEAGRLILQLYRYHDYNRLTFSIDKINEEYLKNCEALAEIEHINKAFHVNVDDYMKTFHLDETENYWLEKTITILQNNPALFRSYIEEIKDEIKKAQKRFLQDMKTQLLQNSFPLIKTQYLRIMEAMRRLELFFEWLLQGEEYEAKDSSDILALLRYSTIYIPERS